jgi:hypothetical protein
MIVFGKFKVNRQILGVTYYPSYVLSGDLCNLLA